MVKETFVRLASIFFHIPQVVHNMQIKLKRELNLSLKRSSTTRTKNKQKSTFLLWIKTFFFCTKNGRSYLSEISRHIFDMSFQYFKERIYSANIITFFLFANFFAFFLILFGELF